MKSKKFLTVSLMAAMALSMAACGGDQPVSESSSESSVTESTQESVPEASTVVEAGPASIDFEDGQFGFIGIDKTVASAKADEFVYELTSFNGSTALKVTPQGKIPYVGIQVDALLGEAASSVKTIEMSVGIENPDGKFCAASGKVYTFLGEDNVRKESPWSVYPETANPKTVTYTVPDGQSFTAGNYMVVSLETDTGKDAGATAANLFIDNITFKDASGNVLTADSSAQYVAVAEEKADRSNLFALKNAVNFEGYSLSAGGWGQNGIAMTQEIIDALVPGSVVEISYASESGDMWLVMNEAEIGWSRVGQGNADGSNSDSAYYNNAKNIAQITYEQIAAVCGDDVSKWGSTMQCESSGAWEVFSIKVGQAAPSYVLQNAVTFEGYNVSAGGWGQNGIAMTQEIIDALVPGSVVEITYTSESGDMWLVMNEAAIGWSRVGQGNADGSGSDSGIFDGNKCYITYEQIAAVCGDDVSTWGSTMQCESSGNWEVYGIRVGKAAELKAVKNVVTFPDFAVSAGGWGQNGVAMPQEIIDALVPGAVVVISYASESGDMWIVMNEAEIGWSRVGQGNADGSNSDSAVFDGSVCQVTYEQIAAVCGDDVSKWGSTMQCESSGNWEVYSVGVGNAK